RGPVTTTTAPTVRARSSLGRRRRWLAGLVIVAALAFLLLRAVGEATVYFKTADEAVAQRAELGDRRFRIEGLVVPGSVRQAGNDVDFAIRGQQGATVDVVHQGNVPELFQPDIPVVMEGRFSGERFVSDRILVKHTSEYRAENPERVREYGEAR
ncbi:MAG: cytochrome c maturation protein CcmE, partial [Actinomycetota bacterium]|nr:cytochrome c maturation protein CcmE [Actinomycetota bacterium]